MAFKITVENQKSEQIRVHLFDRIPVAKTDKIQIKDLTIMPEPFQKNYNDKEGVCFWDVKLAPKEKKEFEIRFKITYPKDAKIAGM